MTGWVLSADGQWLTKLLGLALAAQAWVAWTLRNQPHLGVAKGLAFYQLASATADWDMWIVLADQGIFSTTTGRVLVISIRPITSSACSSCGPSAAPQPPQCPPHSRRQTRLKLRARRHDAPTGLPRQQAQIQGRPL